MNSRKALTRRDTMKILAACGASAWLRPATAGEAGPAAGDDRPNFILIFADDLGYGDLGCFGAKTIRTPELDRLAAEGTRFTDFYVASPLCTPSRSALMTGCYPRRVGLETWVLRPNATTGLAADEITIAEVLKGRDYATGCIGKWHLGFLPPFRPTRQGFDSYYGLWHNLDEYEAKYFADVGGVPLMRNEEVAERPAEADTITEKYTAEALRFIETHKDRPFFLYLAHTMPHFPLGASERFRGKSAGGLYGDAVETLDWSTGQIVQVLRKLGLERRTIVIFTSDNGPASRVPGSAGPLRGQKNTTYEGGQRVPCVMWGPGRIPPGKVCSELVTSMDLYPSFARLAGAKVPADRVIDGRDVTALMLGREGAASPHEAFFYYSGGGKLEAVRAGKWKLISRGKPVELYDLRADIGESRNLAKAQPDVVVRLTKLMQDHEREIARNSRPVGKEPGPGIVPDL